MINKIRLSQIIDLKRLYQAIQRNFSNSFYLELGAGLHKKPDYCFIGFDPFQILEYSRDESKKDFFEIIRNTLNDFKITETYANYLGGLVGFFSYDFIRTIEELPDSTPEDKKYPDALFGLFLDGIIIDYQKEYFYYFFHSQFKNRISIVNFLIDESQNEDPEKLDFYSKEIQFEISKENFIKNVEIIKEKIKNGETFQTVPSQRGFVEYKGNPFKVFLELCEINPSPYLFYFDVKGYQVFGSSPETLVLVKDRKIQTFPIAGTRRIDNHAEITQISKDLLSDPKELAEHNMLVDLGRNDLGKISEIGSVNVPTYMAIQELKHVIHIYSIVEGTLDKQFDSLDAFKAVFPAGTVSGAPKIRSMEIIDILESMRRGPYAGAFGYISLNFNLDMAITIRSFYTYLNKIFFQAGGGVVYDSDPVKEYEETMSKLRSLLVSIEKTNKRKKRKNKQNDLEVLIQ